MTIRTAGMIAMAILAATGDVVCATEVGDLRCEHMKNPLGIDAARPRLSRIITYDITPLLHKGRHPVYNR